jgi:hypothetical protein
LALYVVLHHRRDQVQPWKNNVWHDDERIRTIETTKAIGEAAKADGRVFVHRCGWAGAPARIVCEAKVTRVAPIDGRTCLVDFDIVRTLDAAPPQVAALGMNSYVAAAV